MNLIFLLMLTLSPLAHSANFAVFMGGAENSPEEHHFQTQFGILSTLIDQKKWKVDFLSSYVSSQKQPFTAQSFEKQNQALIDQIRKKEIRRDDQLLLYIGSHGLPGKPDQKTHNVLSAESWINLDSLQRLVQVAEEHGVRLAIVDQSCFSGHLQALGSPKTCVISGSTARNFHYISDADQFAFRLQDVIRKGRAPSSLEEVFTAARTGSMTPGQPQISSLSGRLAGLFTRDFDFALIYLKDFIEYEDQLCKHPGSETLFQAQKYRDLALSALVPDKKLRSQVIPLLQKAQALSSSISSLRPSASEMLKTQNQKVCARKKIKAVDGFETTQEKCMTVAQLPKLKMLKEETQQLLEMPAFANNPGSKFDFESDLDFYQRVESSTEAQEHLQKIEKMRASSPEQFDSVVKELASIERDLYQKLYQYFQTVYKSEPNPCRDFKLNGSAPSTNEKRR